MATNDEAKLASVRGVTGTAWGWNGDWLALFDSASIAAGDFNGRMLAWINQRLGASYTNVNDAQNALAVNQGFIDWSAMGTFSASASLLLNTLSAAPLCFWSVARRVNGNYSGKLIQVRRSSDSTTQDIGYDGSNNLDTASMLSFCGAGNGFISKIYDQSGNGVDWSQSTAANQLQIVSSGSTLTKNTKPIAVSAGSPQFMSIAAGGLALSADATMSLNAVAYMNTTVNGGNRLYGLKGNGQGADYQNTTSASIALEYNTGSPIFFAFRNNAALNSKGLTNNQLATLAMVWDGANYTPYVDGSAGSASASAQNWSAASDLNLFAANPNNLNAYAIGGWGEGGFWDAALGSTDRTAIQTDQKAFWGTP